MTLRTPRSTSARCYVAAPPLTRNGSGPEGAEILREVPGAAGVVLWATLRDVLLFLGARPEERGALFPAGAGEARRADAAGVDEALRAPLGVVAQMMDDAQAARRPRVASACLAVARWAQGHAPATRLAFTQAAALARPADAALALATARLARDHADAARAETWFRRAVKLARGRDWEVYVRAFLGLGVMYQRSGNFPAAGAVVRRALRSARRRRQPDLVGDAHHELFLIATDAGQLHGAHVHAQAALRAYGPRHPRVPYVAHDVGMFWAQHGRFDLALRTFRQVLPCFADALSRTRVLANTARAAAGTGDRAVYEECRARVLDVLAADPGAAHIAAEMRMLVARADNLAGRWDRAEATAREAVQLAAARGELHTRMMAEDELECALGRRTSETVLSAAELNPFARQSARLASEVGVSLEERLRTPAATA
jgi:tetratricopeptide (TPR) repeat protein